MNTNEEDKFEFRKIKEIGQGGFGKVWKVEKKEINETMAMKIMSKVKIYKKRSVNNIKNELLLLSKIDHPFIIPLNYAFQDKQNLYLVFKYLQGGDLRYHMQENVIFNEDKTRFIICCIITALEYLHYNNILHRDIKPENLIFDDKGYINLIDLGVAKLFHNDKENIDSSGTPGYMAPEVINNSHHNFTADYFSIGVIIYEIIFKQRPYLGKSRREIKQNMITNEIKISLNIIPMGWSKECIDYVNKVLLKFIKCIKLLKRKPSQRLGSKNIIELKKHIWMKNVDWKSLYRKELVAPFLPLKTQKTPQSSYFQKTDSDLEDNSNLLSFINKCKEFSNYYYDSSMKKDFDLLLKNPHEEISENIHRKINLNDLTSYNDACKEVCISSDCSKLFLNKKIKVDNEFNLNQSVEKEKSNFINLYYSNYIPNTLLNKEI